MNLGQIQNLKNATTKQLQAYYENTTQIRIIAAIIAVFCIAFIISNKSKSLEYYLNPKNKTELEAKIAQCDYQMSNQIVSPLDLSEECNNAFKAKHINNLCQGDPTCPKQQQEEEEEQMINAIKAIWFVIYTFFMAFFGR